MTIVTVRLLHNSSIPNSRWCEPVGWEPSNVIDGSEFSDGAWWEGDSQTYGLVWLGNPNEYGHREIIEASIEDLLVSCCDNCSLTFEVEV